MRVTDTAPHLMLNALTLLFPSAFAVTSIIKITNYSQRERSRSPRGDRGRRSRSPRRSRRSYSRSRSRSREDYRRSERRSRSPMSGVGGASGGHSGFGYGGRGGPPSTRSFEDRSVAREQMMQSVRDSSQQDRRVYVGNLSYDVKWHHLKDFMRQGELQYLFPYWKHRLTVMGLQLEKSSLPMFYNFRMECPRWAPTCRLWLVFFLVFSLVTLMDCWVDGLGHGCPEFVGLRVSY